jgi:glycosyltransferase involved in cell wall biosynthesis
MRVGYVLKKFPKLSETFVLNEILELERQGAEIFVFSLSTPDEPRFHRALAALQGPIHYLNRTSDVELIEALQRERWRLEGAKGRAWEMLWALLERPHRDSFRRGRLALELALAAMELEIDRFHAHFAGPAAEIARLASVLTNVPFGLTCHAKDIYHESVDRGAFVRLVESADAVVTVCDANRRYIEHELAGRGLRNLHVLRNGVDIDRFHPRHRAPDPSGLILGVGRLVEKKGFVDLIDAVARLGNGNRSSSCVIAGDGRELANLQARIASHGLHDQCELLGAVDHDAVWDLMCRASVLVLPCRIAEDGNRDALPTVILEAMAMGVPVISTPVGGIEEMLVDGSSGLLVPQGDPIALAEALSRLLETEELATDLARTARRRAERGFDLRKNVEVLRRIFSGEVAPSLETVP